jgi:hypothetical protein
MNLITVLLVLVAIGYVLVRRLAGEPLEARRLAVLPIVLAVIGVAQMRGLHATPLDIGVLAAEGAIAVGLGAVRGLTVQVYSRDGHLWYRYRPLTIVVWVGTALVRLGGAAVGHALGADSKVLGAALLVMVAASLLGEALIVGRRALASGVPFAPQGARRGR